MDHTRAHTKRRFMQLSAALDAHNELASMGLVPFPYPHWYTHRYGRLVTLYTEARRRWRASRGWH